MESTLEKAEYIFESDRLGFRHWRASDREAFHEMNADPQVMEFFPAPLSREESNAFFDRIQDRMEEWGYCWYAVEVKESKTWIGFIGLSYPTFPADFTPCYEIGWRLMPQFWGKGYATEGAKACLEYGRDHLGMKEIYSFTSVVNQPSENVMKRIGMIKMGEFGHPLIDEHDDIHPHVLYKTPDLA